jgi:predicted Rossmann fold flavoprotein
MVKTMNIKNVAIIGGGASGIFAAIRCAEVAKLNNQKVKIKVFESSRNFLKKVKISGGGRCNVTHHEFQVNQFVLNYPRGKKELLSPFQVFQAKDTVSWFEERGVTLKSESDGRMFPETDKSETIIQCFMSEIERLGIELLPNCEIKTVSKLDDGRFDINTSETKKFKAEVLLLATGSVRAGYELAKQLGHKITDLAPSLFSFIIKDTLLKEMSGTAFKNTDLKLKIPGSKTFKQAGPLLITHWGLSGPAVLKLSAWAAREMKKAEYRAHIQVNWLCISTIEEVKEILLNLKNEFLKNKISNTPVEGLTKKFWQRLIEYNSISLEKRWADVSKKEVQKIAEFLFSCELEIQGKNRFKDEFVECGGASLKEINFKTMESKICEGLYFSGELLDIDGITGGFNFQNAWATGWIAGGSMAK